MADNPQNNISSPTVPYHRHLGADSPQIPMNAIINGTSVAASGQNALQGPVVLNAGNGISLSQSGQDITITNSVTAFGGNGSDGALSITYGTVTLDMGNASVFIKNYTSISITGSGTLNFRNPNINGTLIILKCQGDVTLTSSSTCIDASGMGASGGTGGNSVTQSTSGVSAPMVFDSSANHEGSNGPNASGSSTASTGGAILGNKFMYTTSSDILNQRGVIFIACGSGGGGGGGANFVTLDGGNGGNGGGALIIQCGGALNFTTSNGIDVSGANGADASGSSGTCGGLAYNASGGAGAGSYSSAGGAGGPGNDNSLSGNAGSSPSGAGAGGGGGSGGNIGPGGGGGGSTGQAVVLYNTLTANTGSVKCAGGNGGAGVQCASSYTSLNNGATGGASDSNMSIVTKNLIF